MLLLDGSVEVPVGLQCLLDLLQCDKTVFLFWEIDKLTNLEFKSCVDVVKHFSVPLCALVSAECTTEQ